MEKFYDLYEPAGEDEKNAYNIDITEDMSVEDVIEKVLKIVENISWLFWNKYRTIYWFKHHLTLLYYTLFLRSITFQ